ncbi:MAG: helix-turn-helix transcriptional regulator [Caldilineaceae bacterium]|nr:helix-turn-helix transcriptional regulator [Caldilineaceae bacterium]
MRIRDIRKTQGITQAELGSRIGLPQSEISRIECGHRTLSVPRLFSIAAALAVHPAALLDESPPPAPPPERLAA